jgi:hypothetical protein
VENVLHFHCHADNRRAGFKVLNCGAFGYPEMTCGIPARRKRVSSGNAEQSLSGIPNLAKHMGSDTQLPSRCANAIVARLGPCSIIASMTFSTIISSTDSLNSPLAKSSTLTITADSESIGQFKQISGAAAHVQILCVGLVTQD